MVIFRKYRVFRYLIIVTLSFLIVSVSVNHIFNGLHDYGATGLIIGLIWAQLLITPFLLPVKWWMKVIATPINAVLPVALTKHISKALYASSDTGLIGGVHVDTICFLIYFSLIIMLFELEIKIHQEVQNRKLRTEF